LAHWTPARRELLAWLKGNAPSLAELYEGSVALVYESSLPGRIRFVSHAVREIRNRLPDAISGVRAGVGRLDYTSRMDEIASRWRRAGFVAQDSESGSSDSPASSGGDSTPVPTDLFRILQALVQDHEDARERPVEAAIRLFESCAPENRALRETLRPLVVRWLDVTGWFQKKAHDSATVDSELAVEDEFRRHFELFESTLGALVRGFFATVEGLDEILEDANT